MMASSFMKDPDANLPFGVDWSGWLPEGDTIESSSWLVPVGLSKGVTNVVGGQAIVWLSGGTAGQTYAVTNRVVTVGGLVDDRTIRIQVLER